MFNEVNKLFGRDFVIAYVLPSLAYIFATSQLLDHYSMRPSWLSFSTDDPLKETTVVVIAVLTTAFTLSALNRPLFRLMEGYWPFGLRHSMAFVCLHFFRARRKHIETLEAERKAVEAKGAPYAKLDEYAKALEEFVKFYPRKEHKVLPTAFGNAVMAFEDYPRAVYCAESICLWARLQALMPKEYVAYLSSLRALTDMWVSLWSLNLLFLLKCLGIPAIAGSCLNARAILVSILVWIFVSWRARQAAVLWGEGIKGAFDVFLPRLQTALGYMRSQSIEEERKFWLALSQTLLYRDADPLRDLDTCRAPATAIGALASPNDVDDEEA